MVCIRVKKGINMNNKINKIRSKLVSMNIDEAFIQKLKNATYIGDLEDKYVDQVKEMAFSSYENDQVLMEALADSEDRKHGIFIYVTEDSLGISLPVPHVAGDHVEFEIPLHEIEN